MPTQGGFLDELQNTYITSVDELPNNYAEPIISWQGTGNIRGYIDISGFHNLSRDGETYYIYGDPLKLAIINSNAQAELIHGFVERIDKKIELSQQGNRLTARLWVSMYWYDMSNKAKIEHYSDAMFETTSEIPRQYTNPIINISIIKYKNVNVLSLNDSGVIKYTVSTRNGSAEHRTHAGTVEYTEKGVPYMNLVPLDIWKCTGKGVCNTHNEILMENTSTINITFETPYGTFENKGAIIYTKAQESTIEPYVLKLFWFSILVISGMFLLKTAAK